MPTLIDSDNALGLSTSSLPNDDDAITSFARDPISCMLRLYREQGDFAVLRQQGQQVAFVFSPAGNQQVLSDTSAFHAHFFAVRGPKRSAQRRLSCGLVGMNGEQHKRNRRLVQQVFAKRVIAGYYPRLLHLTEQLLADWHSGEVVDMRTQMTRHLLRVTSTILFGMDHAETAYELGEMLDQWAKMNHRLGLGAVLPDEDFSSGYEDLLAFAEQLEDRIMQMIRWKRTQRTQQDDVLSILVRQHDTGEGLSDEELVGQSAVLFGAAHLTTAYSLTWTLFLLAQHPQVMRSLHRELQHADTAALARPEVGGENSTLLDRVIRESMRILPASAYSQRITTRGVQLGDIDLPKGTGVIFSPLITHRRLDLYDAPARFLPDRWTQSRRSAYEYLPFGAGPRLCLGGPLAMMIIKCTLPQILRRFRLRVVPDSLIEADVISTMLTPTAGVPMRIDEQDGDFRFSNVRGNIDRLVQFPDAM